VVGERKRRDRDGNPAEEQAHRQVDTEQGRGGGREQAAADQPAITAPVRWRFGTTLPDERRHADRHEAAGQRQSGRRVQHGAERADQNRTAQVGHVVEGGFQRQCRRDLVRRADGVPPARRRERSHLRDARARRHRQHREHSERQAQARADDQPRDREEEQDNRPGQDAPLTAILDQPCDLRADRRVGQGEHRGGNTRGGEGSGRAPDRPQHAEDRHRDAEPGDGGRREEGCRAGQAQHRAIAREPMRRMIKQTCIATEAWHAEPVPSRASGFDEPPDRSDWAIGSRHAPYRASSHVLRRPPGRLSPV
jgi:hypothetical protein